MSKILYSSLICLALMVSSTLRVAAYDATDIICQVNVENVADLNMRNYKSAEVLLGDVIADALRSAADTDIAVVNSGEFIPKLRLGDLTWGNIQEMFPDDREIAVAEVTGNELRKILETGVSHIVMTKHETIDRDVSAYDGFPQISGFSFKYDVSAAPMHRVYEITLNSGESVSFDNEKQTYLLAATVNMLSGGWGYPAVKYTEAGMTIQETMGNYLHALGQITKVEQREDLRGAINEKPIVNAFTAIAFAVIVIICFGVVGVLRKRYKLDAGPDRSQDQNNRNYDPVD